MAERESDRLVEEESEKAAAEAADVGGRAYKDDDDVPADPARRAVEEGGGGVSEGFEQSEDELERQAAHAGNEWAPKQDAFTAEETEGDAEQGEADEEIKPDSRA